jgi:hypothetical protein
MGEAEEPIKGTVAQDFLLQVFHKSSDPKPLKITEGSFQIFSKMRGDIRMSRYTTGINNTSGKFAHDVNYSGLPPVSTTPVANCHAVSTTPVANCHRYQRNWR